jgi:hypothetical protein
MDPQAASRKRIKTWSSALDQLTLLTDAPLRGASRSQAE